MSVQDLVFPVAPPKNSFLTDLTFPPAPAGLGLPEPEPKSKILSPSTPLGIVNPHP